MGESAHLHSSAGVYDSLTKRFVNRHIHTFTLATDRHWPSAQLSVSVRLTDTLAS
jgi:hypothetical protein